MEETTGMSRRIRRLFLLLVVLLAAVWIAPWIVAATGLRNTAVSYVLSDVRGTVTCDSASFGWFSPVVVSDVLIVDEQGTQVATIARAESDKSLLALARDSSELGKFTIHDPQIDAAITADSSNVEEVFHEWIYGESESPLAIELEVTNGTIRLAPGEIKLERLHVVVPKAATDEMTVDLTAQAIEGQQSGSVDAKLAMHYLESSTDASQHTAGRVTFAGNGLPLDIARSIIARFAPGSRISGIAGGTATIDWNDAENRYTIDGDLNSQQLLIATPWLGSDQLTADDFTCKGQVTLAGDEANIKSLLVESELGKVTAEGRLPLTLSDWQQLADEDLTIQGHVDLVRLAALLPDTLRIREGTEITQGKVRLFAQASEGHKGRTWKANVVATDLVARNGQQTITWPEPININVAAYRSEAGPVIERATCQSKFLTIEGTGSIERLKLTAHADLAQLLADVGRFVDTEGIQLAGVVDATLQSNVVDEQIQITGVADAKQLDIVIDKTQLWRENAARAEIKLSGAWRDNRLATIDTARLDIFADHEQAVVRLEKPIADVNQLGKVSLRAGYGGRFGAWPDRIATWYGEPIALPFEDGDAVQLDARVQVDSKVVAWNAASLKVTPLMVVGGRHAPRPGALALDVSADGDWNFATSRLQLKNAVAKTADWTLRAPHFAYTLSEDSAPPVIDATISGDLSKLAQLLPAESNSPRTTQLRGQVSGKLSLSQDAGNNVCTLDAQIDNFAATSATGQRWEEKRLDLDGQFAWDAASEQWKIERAKIAGKDLSADAKGFIALGDRERSLDLSGSVHYDLAKLSILLKSYLGEGFEMQGRDALTFAVRGKLPAADAPSARYLWTDLVGEAKFAWDEAKYQGFHAGPGQVHAKLANGVIDLGRVETTVNEGRVAIRSLVHLLSSGPVLTVTKGQVVDHVKITPEMCRSGIKYVLPLLADVTQAEGALSIELDRCIVPLTEPQKAEVSGRLIAHQAVVSPNQLIGTLSILQSVPTIVRIEPEDVITFYVTNGRVDHKDLNMIFGRDIQISSAGSVGFDNRLDILVQAPIPRGLLGGRPLSESLAKQKIDIRIAGTLDKPRVDEKAVRQTLARLASGTVEDLLNKEIGNALDRLINRRQR